LIGRFRTAHLGAALLIVGTACGKSHSAPAPGVSFAGNWVLNHDLSDTPERQNSEGSGGRRRGGGIMGRGGMGRGGGMGGGRGGVMGGGVDPSEVRAAIQSMVAARAHLIVQQADTGVVVEYGDGSRLVYKPDGKERKLTPMGGAEVKTKAAWKDGALIIDRKLESGTKVHDEVTIGTSAEHLFISTTIMPAKLPREIKFKSVYDRDTRS
jgi:hypothetical protein